MQTISRYLNPHTWGKEEVHPLSAVDLLEPPETQPMVAQDDIPRLDARDFNHLAAV